MVSNRVVEAMTVAESNSNPGEFARGATVLGRYVVDRCLRRDALASVFAARDQSGLWVSIWAAHRAPDAGGRALADRFARAVARVAGQTHPSIPSLLAWGMEADTPVIVSALKPGRSLREMITSEGFIPLDDVVAVVSTVGAALHAQHRATPPIVHGRVVPDRVLFGDEGRVWLEECGYLDALITAGHAVPAQVLAAAPEGYGPPRDRGDRLDPAIDTLQLAALAFEALTGQPPFGAAPTEGSAEERPTPSALRLGLSPELDDLFLAAWRTGSPDGLSSAELFARDFVRIIGDDRSRRPTYPGGDSLSRLRPIDLQLPNLAAHLPFASAAVDTVDHAFDAMLSPRDGSAASQPPAAPSRPPVIEFDTVAEPPPPPPPGVVDMTPVKPTLVGAAPPEPPPEERITVVELDVSATNERRKLLAATAVDDPALWEAPAAERATTTGSPDATSRIGDDILEALRRTTLHQRRAGHRDATHPPPEGPSQREVPPPPDAGTRPSASQRRSSPAPHDPGSPPTAGDPIEFATIPKAPRLPFGVDLMVGAAAPPKLPTSPHDAPIAHDALDDVSIVITQDIVDIDLSNESEASPRPQLAAVAATFAARPAEPPMAEGAEHASLPPLARATPPLRAPSGSHAVPAQPPPPPPAAVPSHRVPASGTVLSYQPPPPMLEAVPSHRPPPPPAAVPSHRPPPTHAQQAPAQVPPERPAEPPPARPAAEDDLITRPVVAGLRARPSPSPLDPPPVSDDLGVTRAIRPTAVPPSPDSSWALAARWCAISTVVSALLVTAGFAFLRDVQREILEELRLAREASARLDPPDAATAPDVAAPATAPDATLRVADATAPDAALRVADAAAPDVPPRGLTASDAGPRRIDASPRIGPAPAAAARDAAIQTPPADATAVVGAASGDVPDATAKARLSAAMRGAISDCVEGIEDPPFVVVNVRYEGSTGAATRVRLHGVFAEAPLGPCIEHAVREVRAPNFSAPFWDTDFRFPVPPPRWRPGQSR